MVELNRIFRVAFHNPSWIPNKPEWLRALACIQEEEQVRIGRFVYQRDAKAALLGRLLIRKAIRHCLSLRNTEFHLSRTERGRPFIESSTDDVAVTADFDFNMSHQGDFTVVTAGSHLRTGVDVMKVEMPNGFSKDVNRFFDLMERQFTASEWSVIRQPHLTEIEQMRLFYRHWCLKEAYVKALGIGIGYEVGRLQCVLQEAAAATRVVTETSPETHLVSVPQPWVFAPDRTESQYTQWVFEEHELNSQHVAAVAWQGQLLHQSVRANPQFIVLDRFSDLIVECDVISKAPSTDWDQFKMKEFSPTAAADTGKSADDSRNHAEGPPS